MKNLPPHPESRARKLCAEDSRRLSKDGKLLFHPNGCGGVPKHLAVIPDGNRRWAKERGLAPWEGHREGVKRSREVYESAFETGISCFTFWAASEDNLIKRSRIEVKFLIMLLKNELSKKGLYKKLSDQEVRVRIIGRWNEILKDKALARVVRGLEEKTAEFKKHNLTILFGYDGKREMMEVIESLKGERNLDYEKVKSRLWTGDLPPVDFVIRTGGEPHWSAGFMMWLTADSQFYFTPKLWPDFEKEELHKALEEYSSRERRMGG